ncbi:MAG: OmpA family protein [Minwuia sp.]|nr:OmpA family protein [Minwuia sp.]
MMDKSSMRTGRGLTGRRIRIAALLMAPVLFGGCSVPDWADPFSSDYGPVPQPVTRAGAAPAIPPAPDTGLAADTKNVRHSAAREVAAVTRDSAAEAEDVRRAAAARPEIQVTRVEAPVVETPRVRAPQVQAPQIQAPLVQAPRVEAAQPAEPRVATPTVTQQTRVAVAPAPTPRTSGTSAPASDVVANSPTPMIAAMTRGQQPPSFNSDGSVVARRTSVQPSSNISLRDPVTPTVDPAPTAVATRTDVRPGTTSTTALASPTAPARITAPAAAPETTLDRTYRDQLRAAGIEPLAAGGEGSGAGAVAPGQFPNSVSPVIQQTYLQSLNAPQTYQQAIGAAPRSAGSTVVVNGGGYGSSADSGPVIISGEGVYQPSATRTASTGGNLNTGSGAAAVIPFGHNSARLSARDDAVIRQIATAARNSNASVRVVGHASSRTGEQPVSQHLLANLRISADRANAVADRIAAFGVPYERIIVEAVGDNQPRFNEAMPSGETGNRRAEIFLE